MNLHQPISILIRRYYTLLLLLGFFVAIASCSDTPAVPYKGFKAVVNGDTIYADDAYFIKAAGGTYIHALKGGKERFYIILSYQSALADTLDNHRNYATYYNAAGKKYTGLSGNVSLSNYVDTLGASSYIKGTFRIGFMAPDSSMVVVTGGEIDTVYKR